MKSKKENEKRSTLKSVEWNPHSIAQALAKELMPRFMADTPPEKRTEQALDEFVARLGAELRAQDVADAAAASSPIQKAEKKNRIKTERVGKIRLAPKGKV